MCSSDLSARASGSVGASSRSSASRACSMRPAAFSRGPSAHPQVSTEISSTFVPAMAAEEDTSALTTVEEVTFPELLRSHASYYTGVCGRSFHLDGSAKTGAAVARVFEKYQLKTFKDRVDFLNTCGDSAVPGIVGEFLDKKPADKPFFLWANFSDPHHPWDAPKEFRPDPAKLVLPPHLPDLPGLQIGRANV